MDHVEKLKVAELRAELSKRRLDTKGTKPVLVTRLREAMAREAMGGPPAAVLAMAAAAVYHHPAAASSFAAAEEEEDEDEGPTAASPEPEMLDAGAVEAVEEEMLKEEEHQIEKEDKEIEMAIKTDEDKKEEGKEAAAATSEEKGGDDQAKKMRRGQKRKFDEDQQPFKVTEDEPEIDEGLVCLDWFNSDLNIKIDANTLMSGEPLYKDGWGFVWAGARATHGVAEGKIFFEVKLLDHLDVKLDGVGAGFKVHEFRVGFSTDESNLQLGEAKLSFCYSSLGKKGADGSFEDFGATLAKDDVVAAYVDFSGDEDFVVVSFCKNGEMQGEAFRIPRAELEGRALFPHVSTKNVKFEVNFGKGKDGAEREAWFAPLEDYEFVAAVEEEAKVRGMARIPSRDQCEMILLIGLPAVGKSTWAAKHMTENPDKRYYVIGTSALIEKMKVNGEPIKKHYEGKWDNLIQKCTRCLQEWLRVASTKRRNFIIDQTNVYPNAQKRKVRPFEGMSRKAIVIVPSEEDFKARVESQLKAENKDVPDNAVMEMKANFTLPEENEENPFKEIIFTELPREEAAKLVEQYNKDARAKGFGKRNDQKRMRGNFRGRMNRGGRGFMPNFRGGPMRGGPMRGGPHMRGGGPHMRGGGGPHGRGGPYMRGGPPHYGGGGGQRGAPRPGGGGAGGNAGGQRANWGNGAPYGGGGNRYGGGGGAPGGGGNKYGGGGGGNNWNAGGGGGGGGAAAPWSQWNQQAARPSGWGMWNQGGGGGGGAAGGMGQAQMGGQGAQAMWGNNPMNRNQGMQNQMRQGNYGAAGGNNAWGNQGGQGAWGGQGNYNSYGSGGGGGGGQGQGQGYGGNQRWGYR